MIRFAIQCSKGHGFEGWFARGEAFDKQAKTGLISCPVCGSTKVSKALMAPNVVTSRKKAKTPAPPVDAPSRETPVPEAPGEPMLSTVASRVLLREMKKLRDKVLAQSDYVGPRFAEEARRIHNEETPARGVHGEASPEDVRALHEDGIEVFPIPVLPDDKN